MFVYRPTIGRMASGGLGGTGTPSSALQSMLQKQIGGESNFPIPLQLCSALLMQYTDVVCMAVL